MRRLVEPAAVGGVMAREWVMYRRHWASTTVSSVVEPLMYLLAFGFDGTTPTTSWWWLVTRAPHAGTPLDLLGTIGGAAALLGAMLLLGHIAQPTLRRAISVITAPSGAAARAASALTWCRRMIQTSEATSIMIQMLIAIIAAGTCRNRILTVAPCL